MDAEEKYHLCPIFDNGAGLLSDIQMDYPMEENINNLMEEARSKTLCEDFDEQIEIAEELYGQQIRLKFNEKDVKEILDMESYYPQEYKERVFEEKKVQIFILNNCTSYFWYFGNKAGTKVFTCGAAGFS